MDSPRGSVLILVFGMADIVAPVLLGKAVDHIPLVFTLVHRPLPPLLCVRPEPAVRDWTQALSFAVEHGWATYHSFDTSWLLSDPH